MCLRGWFCLAVLYVLKSEASVCCDWIRFVCCVLILICIVLYCLGGYRMSCFLILFMWVCLRYGYGLMDWFVLHCCFICFTCISTRMTCVYGFGGGVGFTLFALILLCLGLILLIFCFV